MPRISLQVWEALASLKLTIACLALLMVLVAACTLAEVRLGTFAAVNAYIRSFFIYWNVAGTGWSIPVFPGGGLVGLVLTANLVVAQVNRLEMSMRKLGLWIVHFGRTPLFLGGFVTTAFPGAHAVALE